MLAGHALFAVLLAVGAVRAASPAVLAAAVAAAAWYVVGALWASRQRPAVARAWLAGLVLLWLGMVAVSAEFVWLAFLLAMLAWHLLPPRWAVPVEALLAAASVAAFAAERGALTAPAVLGPVIGITSAAGMTEVYQRLRRQSEERRQLLDKLVRTQRSLAALEREAGRLAERERLAGEIHDTVGQSLGSVVLLLRAALGAAPSEEARAAQLRTALSTAVAAVAETRRFVQGLGPAGLADAGLVDALRALAGQGAALGLPTAFSVHGEPLPLPTPVQVALLRAAQEALSNARRHARATAATVTLTFLDDEVSVDVVDNGAGFDPAAAGRRADGTGFGLGLMRARVAEQGGDLIVESEPGGGTALRATIPVGAVAGAWAVGGEAPVGAPSRGAGA